MDKRNGTFLYSKLLLKERGQKKSGCGCPEFMWVFSFSCIPFSCCTFNIMPLTKYDLYRNAKKIRAHPSVKKGGCYEVHDIEDLVKVGQMVEG